MRPSRSSTGGRRSRRITRNVRFPSRRPLLKCCVSIAGRPGVSPADSRMDRFRKGLEAAGIPYVDDKGEFADFHALRNTLATMLTLAGVSQRVVMELMRHSDMRLTAKVYTDAGTLPTGDAVILVASGLSVSRPVQVFETANVAETVINRGFEADFSSAAQACPKGEMVRDAGFEPAPYPCRRFWALSPATRSGP